MTKLLENTYRHVNIALINELALIFDRLGIDTNDVLAAAGTKWNFLPFTPGLVGGHCIGVDPFYLTAAAEKLGYRPEVILAGRRINDSMGSEIAQKLVKLLIASGVSPCRARVGVLGLTFKQDVPDIRNSKVPDILAELREYGIEALVSDPLADPAAAQQAEALIARNDSTFKAQVNLYKYAERYPEHTREHYRQQAETWLAALEVLLEGRAYLLADHPSLADAALLPLMRQFAGVEPQWFAEAAYPRVRSWLEEWLAKRSA